MEKAIWRLLDSVTYSLTNFAAAGGLDAVINFFQGPFLIGVSASLIVLVLVLYQCVELLPCFASNKHWYLL